MDNNCKSVLGVFGSFNPSRVREQIRPENPDEAARTTAVSPCGLYHKFGPIVGKGAVKRVYRGFNIQTGMSVAWCETARSKMGPKYRQRFIYEARLLSSLNHPNILQFCAFWEGEGSQPSVLITEYMTSGSLKHFIRRLKHVTIKIVKSWCIQILNGLKYLHDQDPPVIHRDLKCDNILINGQTGCIKIGDLGLAIQLTDSCSKAIVGTPEFMAPEVFEGSYDEKVDIYAFGMCMIEMFTSEYPYSECYGPTQIYEHVELGIVPTAFHRVKNLEAISCIGWCLQTNKCYRPTCMDLLEMTFFAEEPPENGATFTKLRTNSKTRPTLAATSSGSALAVMPVKSPPMAGGRLATRGLTKRPPIQLSAKNFQYFGQLDAKPYIPTLLPAPRLNAIVDAKPNRLPILVLDRSVNAAPDAKPHGPSPLALDPKVNAAPDAKPRRPPALALDPNCNAVLDAKLNRPPPLALDRKVNAAPVAKPRRPLALALDPKVNAILDAKSNRPPPLAVDPKVNAAPDAKPHRPPPPALDSILNRPPTPAYARKIYVGEHPPADAFKLKPVASPPTTAAKSSPSGPTKRPRMQRSTQQVDWTPRFICCDVLPIQ